MKGPSTVWRAEEEWLRVQYEMSHHDIWWVKSQQMNAANWTLLLLGALTGLGQLLGFGTDAAKAGVGPLVGALGIPIAALGSWYVWDLYRTLVRSRARAAQIVEPLEHPAFDDAKRPGGRHRGFPFFLTLILAGSLVLMQWYFRALTDPILAADVTTFYHLLLWGWSSSGSEATGQAPT